MAKAQGPESSRGHLNHCILSFIKQPVASSYHFICSLFCSKLSAASRFAAMATIAGRRSFPPTLLLGWQLVVLAFWAGNAAAQGLIVVPKTVTRELGGYYISKLGLAENGLNYYAILSQRNVQTNVYNYVNDIADSDTPRTAAAKISNVRGLYETHTVGGKVKVESFYRLLRCGDDTCFAVNRLIASAITDANGTTHALSHVKTAMGATGWLVNAPQAVVNRFLVQPEEQQLPYVDGIFKTKLFYKVAMPPPPCRCSLSSQARVFLPHSGNVCQN